MNFPDVFELAASLEFIRNSDPTVAEVKGKGWIIDVLHDILKLSEDCDIKDELIVEEVMIWIRKLKRTYKKGQKIKKKDGKELSEEAERWGDLVHRELCARPCIEFQKGALDQRALVLTSKGKRSSIFDRKTWKSLPKIARSDFSDAAKCLLVGASTPAAMSTLRGMEAVIKRYYSAKTKKPAGKKVLGEIINELRKTPKTNMKLLSYMDYIRSEKRNVAQHPNKVFSQREAERIFMEVVSGTHDIYDVILRSEAKTHGKS